MKATRPLHTCASCRGTGKTELSDPLFRALQNLHTRGTRDVATVSKRLCITEQAANARLVALVTLGFAERIKKSKKFVYRRLMPKNGMKV